MELKQLPAGVGRNPDARRLIFLELLIHIGLKTAVSFDWDLRGNLREDGIAMMFVIQFYCLLSIFIRIHCNPPNNNLLGPGLCPHPLWVSFKYKSIIEIHLWISGM